MFVWLMSFISYLQTSSWIRAKVLMSAKVNINNQFISIPGIRLIDSL